MQIIPPEKGYPEFARFRMPAVRWLLAIAMWFGGMSFLAGSAWLNYLSRNSPESPDAVTEQVVELNNHGRFFVRAADALMFNLSCWGGWMIAFFGVVAWGAIFGLDEERSDFFDKICSVVFLIVLVFVGISMFTGGRFPFAMASL